MPVKDVTRYFGSSASRAKPNCQEFCGGIQIPYPFGIGTNCYFDKWFEVECKKTSSEIRKLTPYIKSINQELVPPLASNTVQVRVPFGFKELAGTPFYFSSTSNVFVGVGCNIIAYLADQTVNENAIVWCASVCGSDSYPSPCQASLQENLQTLRPKIQAIRTNVTINQTNFNSDNSSCGKSGIHDRLRCITNETLTLSLQGPRNNSTECSRYLMMFQVNNSINNTSIYCSCRAGYYGNPYLPGGCIPNGQENKKVNSSTIIIGVCSAIGALLLIIGGWFSCKVAKKEINKRKKQKFFKQNGGLLLQQHMSSTDGSVDKTKVFNSYELEKATDHYNANRVLGQGGQGIVYKGMLSDGRIVAVKKSKIADMSNVEHFINEVVILSQINQRNVVKLLGCSLETEVPLLVYEFISNGTLYQHIDNPNEDFPLTWEIRLRIAKEIAGALSYLHSAASMPIYHRDIKSTNILLDDKYKARVCDFGTSRSVDLDKTHLTTRVQGTFGYLDSEYFQSSQFTEKSDVYSFGVVLAELLTGHKPIFTNESQEVRGLAAYFLQEMEEGRFLEIIDPRISDENKTEEIVMVAHLAKRCLHLNGRGRPTMKEVVSRLDGIRTLQEQFMPQENYGVSASYGFDMAEAYDGYLSSPETTSSSLDVYPLLNNQ